MRKTTAFSTSLCVFLCWVWCAATLLAQSASPTDPPDLKRLGIRPLEPLSTADQETANVLFPQSYGVFVGINKFEDSSIVPLECAKNDATELYKLFVEEMQFIPKQNTRLLVSGGTGNDAPTRINILAAVKDAAQRAGEKGSIVVQLSMHGIEGFVLAEDSKRSLLQETAVSMDWVKEQLEKSRCPRRIVIYDACREALDRDSKAVTRDDPATAKYLEAFAKSKGLIVLMSCSEKQFSYEMKETGHGAFTYFILKGLREGLVAPDPKGHITIHCLNEYVTQQVEEWSKNKPSGKQSPILNLKESSGDLPLAMSGNFVAEELRKRMNETNLQLFTMLNNKQLTQACYDILTGALKSPSPDARQVAFDFAAGKIPANYVEPLLKQIEQKGQTTALTSPVVEPGKGKVGPVTGESRFVAQGSLVTDRRLEGCVWYCPPDRATYTYGEACRALKGLPASLATGGNGITCVLPTKEEVCSLNKDYEYAVKALGLEPQDMPSSFWVQSGNYGFLSGDANVAQFAQDRVSIVGKARSEKFPILVICKAAAQPGK